MDNKQLIIIVIAIIVGCCIIAGAVIYSNTSIDKVNTTTNNTTDNITNNTTNNTEVSINDVDTNVKEDNSNVEETDDDKYYFRAGDGSLQSIDKSDYAPCPHGSPNPSVCPACS